MNSYIGVNSTARKTKEIYVGVNNYARVVKKAYIGVNGTARLWYQRGTPLSNFATGSTIKITVNNISYNWIVIQQGNPDTSTYDTSCDGTWLLLKDIYTLSVYSSSSNSYTDSIAYTYITSSFYNLIDSSVRNIIKQVKIPYYIGPGSSHNLATGSNGLSTKIFLLSAIEVGTSTKYQPYDGKALSYFDSDSKRIAYYNGEVYGWWTRTPNLFSSYSGDYVWRVSDTGTNSSVKFTESRGIRPCIILPQSTLIDDAGNILT